MKSVKIIYFLFLAGLFNFFCFAENNETGEKPATALSQLEILKTKFIFLKELLTYPFTGKLPKIREILPDEHSMRLCLQLRQEIRDFNPGAVPDKAGQLQTQKFATFFIREFQKLLPHFGGRADELFFELEESLYQRHIDEIKEVYTAIGDKTPIYPLPKLHIMLYLQEKTKNFSDSDFIKSLMNPAESLSSEWNHTAGLWFLHQGEFEQAIAHLNLIPWRHELEPWYAARIMYHIEKENFIRAEKTITELERKFPETDTGNLRMNLPPEKEEKI
jgi:hypothetical protein